MKKIFLCLLFSAPLFAAFEKKGIGISTTALSMSGVASEQRSFAIFNNSALIKGAFYSELFYRNYYGIKGFELKSIALSGSPLNQPVSLGIIRYGNKLFTETEFAVGISYELNSNIIIGSSMNYYFLDIKKYGHSSTLGFSFSMLYILNDQLRVAGQWANINEPIIGKAKESLPVSGTIGLAFKPIDDVEVMLDGYKEDFYNFTYRIGARIKIMEPFNILSGFQNNINNFSIGFEFNMDGYEIGYAIDVHPSLSTSQAIGFNYGF